MGADGSVAFYHPAHRYFRFLFLALLCFMTFGSYWCYDIPDAIQNQIQDKYGLNQTQYTFFYSVYNFINIVVVLFGGYFIDVIGLRVGSILFCFLIALGQLVFSLGSSIHDHHTAYYVMLAGRAIFSLGGESLSVAQSAYAAKWFKGNELALAFGITLSFSRVGSFANLNVTPDLAKHWGVTGAIWAGSFTCLISLALTTIAALSDRIRDKALKAVEVSEKPKLPFKFSDVLHFPPSLWLIYIICVCYYVPIFTTISISGLKYIESVFHYSDSVGNRYLSIPYIMSAFLAPICGFLVDRAGKKPLFLVIANGLMVGCFAIMLFAFIEVQQTYIMIIAMVLLGMSYSLCASSLWPCVPLLVHEERVGTAYAIMNSIQNGGLAAASVVAGKLLGSKNNPHPKRPMYFLGIVSLASTGFAILLMFYDFANGFVLTKKSAKVADEEKSPLLPNNNDSINTK